ncbi:MAG: hypothetical protein GY928_11635 [Colwellia sp.]|nr:hypothetical protein [Colwellia sp.]
MRKAQAKKLQLFKLSTIKSLHKWLSLLVFIQLFIWLGTGLYFNLMDHSKVRATQYKQVPVQGEFDTQRLLSIQEILAQNKKTVEDVSLIQRLGQPYYLLTYDKGLYRHFKSDKRLVDAYSGEVKVVDIEMASAIAQSSYSGSAKIVNVHKLKPPIADFHKEQNTLWQVNFADELNTSVYLNASSGRLVGHSNDDKRFADFLFMLHFMDYSPLLGKPSSGFNNWQVIFFALLTLVFCSTGLIWTLELLIKGRYKFRS